jgi:glycosyltransferase involved in cell wall biosynthesis
MKILYLTLEDVSLHKGSVVHIREIVSGLHARGHTVGLLARNRGGIKEIDFSYNLQPTSSWWGPLKRLRTPNYLLSSLFLFFSLWFLLPRYDVVYARDFHAAVMAWMPRWVFGKKLVYEINGLASEEVKLKGNSFRVRLFSMLIRGAERIASLSADLIISVTPQIASYLVTRFHVSPSRVEIVGNGVDPEKFFPLRDPALLNDWRRRLGIEEKDRVIGFVGNLAPWQGMDILIESALRLLSRMERLKFLIVGDGVMKPRLLTRVTEQGLGRAFIFTGMMPYETVPVLINVADICVAPFIARRNKETGVSPLKVFEYLACGKPVIASRIEGLEVIERTGVGILVEPQDSADLERALLKLLNEPQLCKEMGRRGLNVAREEFSWESRVATIEHLLTGLA